MGEEKGITPVVTSGEGVIAVSKEEKKEEARYRRVHENILFSIILMESSYNVCWY
jgi:hypothetical protein